MSDTIIHNIKVSYDESHDRVKNFVEYLKNEKRREEMKAYYEEAKRSPHFKMHINDEHNNEFTLECEGDHRCDLRLRGM